MPLADAFIADPSTVATINESTQPVRDLEAIEVKGIDIVKLGQLRAILAGIPFVTVLPEFPEVHAVSDDGPWVFEVSPALVASLAELQGPQIADVATMWSVIREFKLDGFDPAAVLSILRQFVLLAQQARAKSQGVYLWSCL